MHTGAEHDGKRPDVLSLTVSLSVSQSFRQDFQYRQVLDWMSITGLSLSLLGLVLTIIYHIRDK